MAPVFSGEQKGSLKTCLVHIFQGKKGLFLCVYERIKIILSWAKISRFSDTQEQHNQKSPHFILLSTISLLSFISSFLCFLPPLFPFLHSILSFNSLLPPLLPLFLPASLPPSLFLLLSIFGTHREASVHFPNLERFSFHGTRMFSEIPFK